MRIFSRTVAKNPAWSALVLLTAALACSNEVDFFDEHAAGGAGGAATNAGSSNAGASGSSGSPAGGTAASGAPATGGSGGSAGSVSPSAGTNSAGTTSAGTGTGGESTGGTAGAAAGTAGTSTSGSGGSGTGATGGAAPTSGCEASDWPPAQKNSLMVEGTDVPREFIVALPEDYDPTHPYRLVFAFHGLTGTAEQIAGNRGGYYGLASGIGDSTILVSPQGLAPEDEPDQFGWPNTDGRDIAFVRAMVSWLGSSYCIDAERIFSVGMSYGGIMSNTIGCEMSDVFRGIAPIAGAIFGRGGSCDGPPLAVWMAHGTEDETVTFEQGETARDVFLEKNQCDTSAEPTPVEPEGCVAYQGCADGAPLVWCVHDGGHIVPSFTGEAVSAFFSMF